MEVSHQLDREKLGAFVRDSGKAAVDRAYRMTRNHEDAEDLAQEAYRRLAQYWERYGSPRSVECLFVVILKNTFLDRCRRSKVENSVSLDASPDPAEDDVTYHEVIAHREVDILDQLIRQDTAERVWACLYQLNRCQRTVLLMADVEDRSYREIAAVMEVPIGSVRSRLFRARRLFRQEAESLIAQA